MLNKTASVYRGSRYTTVTYYKGKPFHKVHRSTEPKVWVHRRQHALLFASLVLFTITMWQVKLAVHHQGFYKSHKAYAATSKELVSPTTTIVPHFSPSPVATVVPLPSPATKWEEVKQAVDKIAPVYNFPKQVVLSQAALESARGNSDFCQKRNNCLGLGAYTDNPDNAFVFENVEQSVIFYFQLLKTDPRYKEVFKHRDNPKKVIEEIKAAGFADDPNYVYKVTTTPEWSQN